MCKMLELINVNQEELNTRERISIDLLKDGLEFLEKFVPEINHTLLLDTVSIIYKFLKATRKIPHNIYKFFVAAYYIVSRHPKAFPVHQSKKSFCRTFGLQPSSLDYSVERIVNVLGYIKILDDKNYPYFINPKSDLAFKLAKCIVKTEVDKVMMEFLMYNEVINSQILSEDLITKIIFEINLFPEELFRQFFDIIFRLIEKNLLEYNEYVRLQKKHLI